MRRMLRWTSYAVSTDETRYVLNGVCLSIKTGLLSIVATDGRRLALVEEQLKEKVPSDFSGNYILPTKAVNELMRALSEKGEVIITLSQNYAGFNLAEDSKKYD